MYLYHGVAQQDRGEHFDPWLLDLFEEEIRKAPVPKNPSHQVMISAAGVLPYKAAQGDWVIDRFPDGEDDGDDELIKLGQAELDVEAEDSPAEKTAENTVENPVENPVENTVEEDCS